jgi:hypothetical protein
VKTMLCDPAVAIHVTSRDAGFSRRKVGVIEEMHA